MPARTFFIETFGCQMNEHDSEKIAGLLAHRGMIPVQDPDQADLFLLNTCSVREKAAQKVYSRLGEVKGRKKTHPGFLIGVVGCVAQQEGARMVQRVPFVDLVVGTHQYHLLPDLLEELERRQGEAASPQVLTEFLPEPTPVEMPAPFARLNRVRANITIMEGCNKHCSFCVVPYTRGPERNRPARLILEEARRALEQGYPEIQLLGQTVNSYRDPTRRGYRFAELLADLALLPGLRRLRFTSPHPREFNDACIQVIAQYPVICDQIHLPVQSGSSRLLRRMRRQYTREGFLELVARFNACGRFLRYSTDIIVGFPGEEEEDFEQTLSLVEEVGFESMFSFKYSPRPFTESSAWADDVPEEVKTRRLMTLQRRQREIQLRLHRERYLGQCLEVLVEGQARDGEQIYGRTSTNKIVNFPGQDPPGSWVKVLITEVGPNSLRGRKVQPQDSGGHDGKRI